MKIILFLFVFLVNNFFPQGTKDFWSLSKGKINYLFLSIPPKSNDAVFVLRKGPLPTIDDYVLLNGEHPIRAILDPSEARNVLASDWDEVSEFVNGENEFDLLRKIRGSSFTGTILSFLYPSAAIVSGRLFRDSTIINGKKYEYKLIYVDENSNQIDSIIKVVDIKEFFPTEPNNINIKGGDEIVELSWDYPDWESDETNMAIQFNVYRKIGNSSFTKANSKPIIRLDNTEKKYADVFLSNGEKYSYYITASDAIGRESKPSKTVTIVPKDNVPPGIPEGLSAIADEGGISITWYMNVDIDAAGYHVYRGVGGTTEMTKLTTKLIPLINPIYKDEKIHSDVQYFYSVTCLDGQGNESGKSNPLAIISEDKIAPDPPENITCKIEKNVLKISWKKPKDKDIKGYNVYVGTEGIIPKVNAEIISSTYFEYQDASDRGSLQGGIYSVMVASVDNAGNESERASAPAIQIKDMEAPSQPERIIVSNIDGRFLKVNVSSSMSPDVVKYILLRQEVNSKKEVQLGEYFNAPFEYLDRDIVLGNIYQYASFAVDKAGNKSEKKYSEAIQFAILIPPATPFNVTARHKNNIVELSWNPLIDKYLAGYNIYRSNLPNGEFVKINDKPVKDPRYIDSGGKKSSFYKITSYNIFNIESPQTEYIQPK